jgi:hypothetical protein
VFLKRQQSKTKTQPRFGNGTGILIKPFGGEAEFIEQWNRRNLRLPGEKGVFYDEGRGSQDYVNDTPIPSDRAIKAIKYFQSFCPGTKRNSAF